MLELLTILVVVFVECKCLMSSHIYRGGMSSFRDSREFYHFLAIYMCWNCKENFRVFTSSHVLELSKTFRNWAKLALFTLCWLSNPKLWAIGIANWADRNTRPNYGTNIGSNKGTVVLILPPRAYLREYLNVALR